MPNTWKTVRVFISSTFRDMHAERDHLVKVVFPALRERLEKHRVYLIDIDLRWGVTREQAQNDQVLDLWLQQIDESRPFFVGILGQRYGWVPTRYAADALKKFGWIQHHTGKSGTKMEILHGVLQDSKMRGRAFFYFRDPVTVHGVPEAVSRDVYAETDAESIHKLEDLKRQIRFSGCPVMENYPARWDADAYDQPSQSPGRLVGLEAFGKRVQNQLWQAVQEKFQLPGQPSLVTTAEALDLFTELQLAERTFEAPALLLRLPFGRLRAIALPLPVFTVTLGVAVGFWNPLAVAHWRPVSPCFAGVAVPSPFSAHSHPPSAPVRAIRPATCGSGDPRGNRFEAMSPGPYLLRGVASRPGSTPFVRRRP